MTILGWLSACGSSPAGGDDRKVTPRGLGDSLYPDFGNAGYDVEHYTLELDVHDVATSGLSARASIQATALEDLTRFELDFIGLSIEQLDVDGADAAFTREGQKLIITPPQPLRAQQSFEVEVHYTGSPRWLRSVYMADPAGWITTVSGSYVLSEPDGAATYYPVNDHPLDKASYTFQITVPKPWGVAANGVLEQTIDDGDITSFVFEARDRMASYLTTVAIAELEQESDRSPGGVPLRNYFAKGLPDALRAPFALQGEMLDYYSELFGPYPFEVYGAIALTDVTGSAQECQTAALFGIDQLDTSEIRGAELTVAHELSHQWFGNSVSVADFSEIWLNEGFATYSEALWLEHTDGRAALDAWVSQNYDATRSSQGLTPPGKPTAEDLFNDGVYYWGALALHALRLHVGDDVFFQTLHVYAERFRDGNVRTADFQQVAEAQSGLDLSELFDAWIYGDELPPIPELGLTPN